MRIAVRPSFFSRKVSDRSVLFSIIMFSLKNRNKESAEVTRITRYSFINLITAFSKRYQAMHSISRLREVLFGNHWLSEILCEESLKPVPIDELSRWCVPV